MSQEASSRAGGASSARHRLRGKIGAGMVCCLALGTLPCGIALALPGERVSAVVASAQRKPFTIAKLISEISGMAMYNATTPYAGANVLYHIEDTANHLSFQELVRYDAPNFVFVHRSDGRVRKTIALVYDDAVAQDYLNARVVATIGVYRNTPKSKFFRGARFAYRAFGDKLTLFALKYLAAQIESARRCATMECGD